MGDFLKTWAENKKKETLAKIRPEIQELAKRGNVTHEEYNDLRMNSYEREHLHPHLTNDALVRLTRYYLTQIAPKYGSGPCITYNEAVLHNLLPLILERLENESV